MGRRGPAPKPNALRALQGNAGKRSLPRNEPKPPPVAPKCPAWLDKAAKKEWRRVTPLLLDLGLLTEVDALALASYCQAYSMLVRATKVLNKPVEEGGGLTFTTENGYQVQRPEVSIAQKSMQLIKAFCAEFGFTPSARGRMQVPNKKPEKDEYEDFRRKRNKTAGA